MNLKALAPLSCETRLEIVSGATHLFEEPASWVLNPWLARRAPPTP